MKQKIKVEIIKRLEDVVYILNKIKVEKGNEEKEYEPNILFDSLNDDNIKVIVKNFLKENNYMGDIYDNLFEINLY